MGQESLVFKGLNAVMVALGEDVVGEQDCEAGAEELVDAGATVEEELLGARELLGSP